MQELNSFALSIFENCADPVFIKSASAWSSKPLEEGDIASYLNTYANLLYNTFYAHALLLKRR